MDELALHEFHQGLGASFGEVSGREVVLHYGDAQAEHAALMQTAGVLDLSCRSRLRVLGSDRVRFLNGQVTNDVKALGVGQGCYAALLTPKGRMVGDANLYRLADEFLLDAEPGQRETTQQRFDKYIIADDVHVIDAMPHYGLLSIQGPQAAAILRGVPLPLRVPARPFTCSIDRYPFLGELCLVNHPRTASAGFDVFVPVTGLPTMAAFLRDATQTLGGRWCGWQALETARIEAGVPRFGADMDETNLPLEAGIEERAISYTKGCYIGQEVIARLRAHGHVTKTLRGLRLADALVELPVKGDKLFKDGQEVGYVTSAVRSPALSANIALGYVRHEVNAIGTALTLRTGAGAAPAHIVSLPFPQITRVFPGMAIG